MGWTKGFNFRNTLGWATDQADETHVIPGSAVYPQTRNGVTFGFETFTDVGRDRGAGGLDRRLAGCFLIPPSAGTPIDFRIDLPAPGDYTIRLARGDASQHLVSQSWDLRDTNTSLANFTDANGHADFEWNDATGVTRTDTTWPSNNASILETFTTTIARHRMDAASSEGSGISHIFMSTDLTIIQVSETITAADRQRVPV